MPTSPNKTVQSALIAWMDIASAAVVLSSAFNCAAIWGAALAIRLGRRTGTAFTDGWPNIRVDASPFTSGSVWLPIYTYRPAVGLNIANTTLNGVVSMGATTFVVNAATNIAIGDLLFLGDPTPSNYEIVRVKSLSGTTITPEEPVVNAHATAALVTDQAEMVFPPLDLSTYVRLRVAVDNSNSGQAISIDVQLLTFDSFG